MRVSTSSGVYGVVGAGFSVDPAAARQQMHTPKLESVPPKAVLRRPPVWQKRTVKATQVLAGALVARPRQTRVVTRVCSQENDRE